METTKPKLDVKALVAKANAKVKSVKESTEKVQSIKETFRIIPGFSTYEFNGNIVRNVKTKNIISMKTGRTKYQLTNDADESKNLSKDEIKALFFDLNPSNKKTPVAYIEESGTIDKKVVSKIIKERKKKEAKPKKEKVTKEKVYKGEKHVVKPMDHKLLKSDALKIMESDINSFNQVVALFNAGYSKQEIVEITGRRSDVVSKYIRPLLKNSNGN